MRKKDPNLPMRTLIFDFIVAYKMAHNGNSPSHLEIGEKVGAVKSQVKYHLKVLQDMGVLEVNGPRSISIPRGLWIYYG